MAKGDAAYDYDLWTTEETTVFRKKMRRRSVLYFYVNSVHQPRTEAASGSWEVRGVSEACPRRVRGGSRLVRGVGRTIVTGFVVLH